MKISIFPKQVSIVKELPEKENLWVFMMAGQSNMAGGGIVESQDTLASNRVLTISKKGRLILAKEPIDLYNKGRSGLSCGVSFGKNLVKEIPNNISILIIPTAIGATSIEEWLADEKRLNVNLLSNFREKLELGEKYGIVKGILWHQGESDAVPDKIPSYEKNLKKLFSQFRSYAKNLKLPILTAELGSFSTQPDQWEAINKVIRTNALNDPYTTCFSTSDLKDRGDKVHFNSASQRTLGIRFAQNYLDTFYKKYKD